MTVNELRERLINQLASHQEVLAALEKHQSHPNLEGWLESQVLLPYGSILLEYRVGDFDMREPTLKRATRLTLENLQPTYDNLNLHLVDDEVERERRLQKLLWLAAAEEFAYGNELDDMLWNVIEALEDHDAIKEQLRPIVRVYKRVVGKSEDPGSAFCWVIHALLNEDVP